MIKLIVNIVAGIGLFAGSAVGVLAVTGRLNHEGTQGLPLISAFFAAPPPEAGGDGNGEPGKENGKDAGRTDGHGTAAGSAQDPAAQGPDQPSLKKGRSVFETEKPAGDGGHGAPPADPHGTAPADPHAAQGPEAKAPQGLPKTQDGATQQEQDFQKMGQNLANDRGNAYSPGNYFRFDGLPAGITPEKLNEAWERVQQQIADIQKRNAAIDQREADLRILEQDIARRQTEIAAERTRVETMQKDLEGRIAAFQQQVKMVRLDEVAGLKRNAATLASFSPAKAAELVQENWRSEAGQDLMLKTLEVMDKDKANGILGALPNGMVRDVLERRLRVVREQAADGGR